MSDITNTTIIKADASNASKSIADLRSEVKQLKQELDECAVGSQEATNKSQALAQAQVELKAAMKGAVDEANALDNSYNGLVAQMASLKAAQKAVDLSTEEGQKRYAEYAKQINGINDQLKELDAQNGVFARNVGNYVGALQQMPGILGQIGGGISSVGAQAKTLMANPWIAAIGAIVALIMKVVDQFKKSEERMRELDRAMASFRPILDAINRGFDKMAELFSKVLGKSVDFIVGKLKQFFGWLENIAKKFGWELDLVSRFEEGANAMNNLVAAEQALVDRQRKFATEEARIQLEVAKIRDKVAQKEAYNARERLEMIDRAFKMERGLAQERVAIAKEALRLAELEAARGVNNAEVNDKLAQAKTNVYLAEKQLYDETRRLQELRNNAIKQIREEKNAYDQLGTTLDNIAIKASDVLSNAAFNVKTTMDDAIEYTEDWAMAGTRAFDTVWKKASDPKKAKMAMRAFTDVGNAVSNMLGSVAANFDENSKEYKGLMITQTIVSMLTGIAQAVSQAMELGPIAGPIMGAINAAAVTATGIASITQIKSANANSSPSSTAASSSGASQSVLNNIVAPVEYAQATGISSESQQDTRVYVTETDISSTQRKVSVAESEARLQ